jgi:hypothetical protein
VDVDPRFRPTYHFSPVHTGPDAVSRLALLGGLTVDMLHRAAAVGDQARREVSPLHRSNYSGTRMQAETFGDLAEQLVPLGWKKPRRKEDILERLHAPSGRFALTVNSGTADVGLVDGVPSTRHPRGGAGQEAIDTNQGMLFDLPVSQTRDDVLTWFALFYVNEREKGQIYMEVSLPELRDGGRIVAWRERIILPPLDPPAGHLGRDSEPSPVAPDVDVPVFRRAK